MTDHSRENEALRARVTALEARIASLEAQLGYHEVRQLPMIPGYRPLGVEVKPRCSCPPGTVCMSVACPYRMQITCGDAP